MLHTNRVLNAFHSARMVAGKQAKVTFHSEQRSQHGSKYLPPKAQNSPFQPKPKKDIFQFKPLFLLNLKMFFIEQL
jgi:hypothetical protein